MYSILPYCLIKKKKVMIKRLRKEKVERESEEAIKPWGFKGSKIQGR